jgi:hypothetical protein
MNIITGVAQRVALSITVGAAVLLASGSAGAQALGINTYACGPLAPPGQYGPFDYRTAPPDVRHRVEDYHFTPVVEQGLGGSTGTFGSDVDYTLRAFPNNPRALLAVARFSLQHHTERAPGARYVTECYFDRAVRFQPDDPMVHLLYAAYLKDRKRTAEARTQLDEAERLRGDAGNFDLDYNIGLLYFDIGAYDKALVAAKRAYALGAPLPALQNKLKAAGKWNDDPLPAPAPAPAPAAATPAPVEPDGSAPAAADPASPRSEAEPVKPTQ